MSGYLGRNAVVLGGGMAGLLSARVLSDYYERVAIVDRDKLAGEQGPRRGVPHARHAHALLARGQLILEDLFPGLLAELVDDGIPVGDLSGNLRWYFNGKPLAQKSCGLVSVSSTRPVLEAHVRDRVLALSNVDLLDQRVIQGLCASADHRRITGVRVGVGEKTEVLDADLVVDTTGRGSRAPAWLEPLGYQRPDEDRIKIDLVYTTRHFRLRDDPYGTDLSINPVASPANPRGAFFPKLSDGTSMLSLTGILGDHPPRDHEGFLAFAKTLAAPEIYQAIQDAEPVDEAVSFHVPASVRRRYDRLSSFPDGFLVLGDGVCAFNPVYGQGMTVAAMEVMALREHLAEGTVRPLRFFRSIAPIIDTPWETSASADLAFPGVEGKRTLKARMGNAFIGRLHTAAQRDARFTAAFFRVAGLVDPPETLMRPGFILDVLRSSRRENTSSVTPTTDSSEAASPTGSR